MATPGFTHFIVTGIGVREARSAVGRDVLVRDRAGRQQVKLQVLKNRRSIGYVAEPQWFDEALVFLNHDAAGRRSVPPSPPARADDRQRRMGRCVDLVSKNAVLHPAWPGNQ
jgi:hypothetical protein